MVLVRELITIGRIWFLLIDYFHIDALAEWSILQLGGEDLAESRALSWAKQHGHGIRDGLRIFLKYC